jgi:hypothetical protein
MIFRVIGYGRVVLGGASGVALFSRAAFGKDKSATSAGARFGLVYPRISG